jgi:hypothetical protein
MGTIPPGADAGGVWGPASADDRAFVPVHGFDALVGVAQLVTLLTLRMRCIAVSDRLRRHSDSAACDEENQYDLHDCFNSFTPGAELRT